MRSEMTVVPPVTAERSPPDSRMTGADSPVIAASLTEAMPSITSPSPGMTSPASQTTRSPACSSVGRDALVDLMVVRHQQPFGRRLCAGLAQRVGLRLAAAFRHRLGEVGKQYGEPQPDRRSAARSRRVRRPIAISRTSSTLVSSVTISSTNITGFLTSVRGSSLTKAWPIAGTMIFGSSRVETGIRLRSLEVSMVKAPNVRSEQAPACIARCSAMGPSASAGKKVRPPTIRMTPTSRPTNSGPVVGKVPLEAAIDLLLRQRAGNRHRRNDHPEAADEHRDGAGRGCRTACCR